MKIRKAYSFDDLLLIPRYSDIASRSQVDISVDLGRGIKLDIPIISSCMRDISGVNMVSALAELGGLGLLHRFWPRREDQLAAYKESITKTGKPENIGCSVGVKTEDLADVEAFVQAGCKIICVDVAHGWSRMTGEMIYEMRKRYPDLLIIAGNVATGEGAKFLSSAGADVIRCSIGSGSLCSTRIETGNGVPIMTTLEDTYKTSWANDAREKRKYLTIADGGLRRAGDLVKALCFSDAVMLGNLLAGTDEAAGKRIILDGIEYKEYAGSSTHRTSNVEGISGLVRTKGPMKEIIQNLVDGLKSGLSYQGVRNLVDLKKNPEFVEISNAGLVESHPHAVIRRE